MLRIGNGGGYRVPIALPKRDFFVGCRTPTTFTAVRDDVGTSATSKTVGAGLVGTDISFTTQAGVTDWTVVGHPLFIVSASNSNVSMAGTLVSYVGTTLTVHITSVGTSGTKADWSIRNLPAGFGYDPAQQAWRASTPMTISGWNFDGCDAAFYLQASVGTSIDFVDCTFGLSNFTKTNVDYMRQNVATTGTWTASYCTFRGYNNRMGVNRCFGNGFTNLYRCDVVDWPADVISGGNTAPITDGTTLVRQCYLHSSQSAAFGTALHADGIQIVGWLGGNYEVDNCVIDLTQGTAGYRYGGCTITSPINFGVGNNFAHDVYMHDNVFIGGTFCTYWGGGTPGVGTFRYLGNYHGVMPYWTDLGSGPTLGQVPATFAGGPIYNLQAAPANLTVDRIRSAWDGSILPFVYNANGSQTGNFVTSVP